jgi:hypothetical protein
MPATKLKKPEDKMGQWLREYCPRGCGTKLRTNGRLVWCSFVDCDYVIVKKEKHNA